MNRKQFIKTTSALAITSLTGSSFLNPSTANAEAAMPIIDTHQHLWDIKRFGAGWSKPPLDRNFDEKDYIAATSGLNIVKAVYMEVGVPVNKRLEEALYVVEMCRDTTNPTVAAVIAADPNSPDFITYLSQFAGSPYIKGLRYFFKSAEELNQERVITNLSLLAEMEMSFDFSIPTSWLPEMKVLISRCPETKFLLNHCGNADPRAFFSKEDLKGEKPDHDRDEWISDMQNLASLNNVVCKISGVTTRAMNHHLTAKNLAAPINQCLDIFGPDRVMFASDWPVCLRKMALKSWVDILKEIVSSRPYDEQKKMFHDNAVKFYTI